MGDTCSTLNRNTDPSFNYSYNTPVGAVPYGDIKPMMDSTEYQLALEDRGLIPIIISSKTSKGLIVIDLNNNSRICKIPVENADRIVYTAGRSSKSVRRIRRYGDKYQQRYSSYHPDFVTSEVGDEWLYSDDDSKWVKIRIIFVEVNLKRLEKKYFAVDENGNNYILQLGKFDPRQIKSEGNGYSLVA